MAKLAEVMMNLMILCENNYQRVIYTNQLLQPEAYGRFIRSHFQA